MPRTKKTATRLSLYSVQHDPSSSSSSRGTRRGRGGSTRGRGGGRRGGGSGYTPYQPPSFSQHESLYMSQTDPNYATKLDAPGIKSITFGADFDIMDQHLQAIISRPQLASRMQKLALGDSDTGNGGSLSDIVMQSLLTAAPNLRILSLDACKLLTDETLVFALTNCPALERLAITGNDKIQGSITAKCLKDLAAQPSLGSALKELVLYDQGPLDKEAKALSAARKGLAVKTGETLGDGYADNYIAAITGGAQTTTFYNGKMVGLDVDGGLFGPGGYDFPGDDHGFY